MSSYRLRKFVAVVTKQSHFKAGSHYLVRTPNTQPAIDAHGARTRDPQHHKTGQYQIGEFSSAGQVGGRASPKP